MSARKRWLRRANAWMAGNSSTSKEVKEETKAQVAEGSPIAISRALGWAAKSGLGVLGLEISRIDLEKKELQILEITDEKLELQQEFLHWKEERERERQAMEAKAAAWDEKRRQLESALERKTELLKQQGEDAARLTRRLEELESDISPAGAGATGSGEVQEALAAAAGASPAKVDVPSEIQRLNEEVGALRQRLQQRDTRLRTRRQRMVQALRSAREGESAIRDLRHELEAAREQRVQVVAELEQIRTETQEMCRRLENLQEEKAAVEEERDRISAELAAALRRGEEQEASVTAKEEMIADLREALAGVGVPENEADGESRQKLNENLSAAVRREVLRQREAEIEDRDQQGNILQNGLAGFASLREGRELGDAGLTKRLEQVRKEHPGGKSTLKRILAETGNSKEQFGAQLEDMRGTLDAISRELEDKKRQTTELDRRLASARQLETKLTEELSFWRRSGAEKDAVVKARETQISALQEQCQELESKLDERSSVQLAKTVNERERLKVALEARDHEMREQGELLNQARQELRKVRRQLDERGREVSVYQKDLDLRRDSESRALLRARQSEKQCESLRAQLAEQERRTGELGAQIERQRAKFAGEDEALSQRVVHLESALRDRERNLKASESEVHKLRNAMEILRADLRLSEAKLQQQQAEGRKKQIDGIKAGFPKTLGDDEMTEEMWDSKERLRTYKAAIEKVLREKNAEIAKLKHENAQRCGQTAFRVDLP